MPGHVPYAGVEEAAGPGRLARLADPAARHLNARAAVLRGTRMLLLLLRSSTEGAFFPSTFHASI